MKIIFESDVPSLKFSDVKENQFFVNDDGYLSQKTGTHSYNTIADECGTPFAHFRECVDGCEPIDRILPAVKKIEF